LAGVLHHAQHHHRIHDRDRAALLGFINHHIAGQEQSDLQLLLKRSIRKLGIAGTQDDISAELSVQFLLQCLADVDLGQHPESLRAQFLPNPSNRLFKWSWQFGSISIRLSLLVHLIFLQFDF